MRRSFKRLSFGLILALGISMINVQTAHADIEISVTPRYKTTCDESFEIYISTGGVECYVKYSNSTDRPSVESMWRMPAGAPNVQDCIEPGITYLHIYVPSEDQWLMTGPYIRESAPPDVPVYIGQPTGWVKRPKDAPNVTYQIYTAMDHGEAGYDAPNGRPTYYASGFKYNETWRAGKGELKPEGEQTNTITVSGEGWKQEYARSYDVIGNISAWGSAEFGIDCTAPTIVSNTLTVSDGLTVDVKGMEDHGLSGNKQLTFDVYTGSVGGEKLSTKQVGVTAEGENRNVTFSSSDLGGYSSSETYYITITTEDQVGNTAVVDTLTAQGNIVHNNPTPPTPPVDPTNPDEPEPEVNSKVGAIKFDPYKTSWTNKGKTGEGEGAYPVKVYYDGTNPYKATGKATIEKESTDSDGNTKTTKSTKSFTVTYDLESIDVTGDANDTVDGDSGTINIENEGENQTLHGEGNWGEPQGDPPEGASDVKYPTPPSNPVGDSGRYNIDWTKPEYTVTDEPEREWHNDEPTYDVDIKIHDELSGIKSGKITVDDSSHYGHDSSVTVTGGKKDFSKTINLDDGIYSINVNTKDVATNENDTTYKTYYEDHTKPEISFDMDGKQIFSVANGATRKASKLGIDDSFYGKLTASDNLSGIKKISYEWTYGDIGDTDPESKYRTIYTSADTYYDRYNEIVDTNTDADMEIEKPVGDNLYLHVRVKDEADNYTYECYGPYEDSIKLLDYQISDIRDPRWQDVFWNDTSYKSYKNVNYKANALPIDEASHPTLRNAYPKKGYAFYFDITSEYLYREADRIEVKPTFYYKNIFNQRIPLDLYYNYNNNPLVLLGSTKDALKLNLETTKYGDVWIGGLSQLTLTKGVRIVKGREWLDTGGWKDEIQYRDGKIQWWYGKYLIPATSIFVKQGDTPRPENIVNTNNIIVNFQIVAYKNGIETLSSDQIFTYVPNQWTFEGGPKNSNYLSGDVMVFDNKYSALSDYTAHVIQ